MDLGDWRSRINDIDNQILNLLNQRAEAALRIGDLKRRQEAPSYVPEREAELLTRLTAAARGAVARGGGRCGLARDRLRLPRVGRTTDRRLSGTAGHVHAPGRARPLRRRRRLPPVAHDRRDLRRRRARARAVRRGPGRELHRRRRERHPRPAGAHRAADLRRADAGDRPAAALARPPTFPSVKRVLSHPAGAGPVPGVAGRATCPTCRSRRPRRRRGRPSWPPPTRAWRPSPPSWPASCTGCRSSGAVSRTTRTTPRASSCSGAARADRAVATRRRSCSRCRTSRARCTGSWSHSPGRVST